MTSGNGQSFGSDRSGTPGYCSVCGAARIHGARFCSDCGSLLRPLTCPVCGTEVLATQRFCGGCGAALFPEVRTGPFATTETGSREMLAERRLMTVLFCDLVGSSKLTVQMDPEEYAELVAAYRERCAATVTRHGGHVSSYVGDGILACFGYPRALGRDARSAVACGLDIVRDLAALAGFLTLPAGAEIAVRIGIETGVVVAGQLGRGQTMERDAFAGAALPVAARLEEIAPANGVVIGEATQELVADDFIFDELPPERLQRLPMPSRAFLVVRPRLRQGRWMAIAHRRALMANRLTEMEALRARWNEACDEHGQIVLISGEPGIGKSRLVQELLDWISASPHALVALVCTPQTITTALHPAIEALRDRLATAEATIGTALPVAALEALAEAAGLPRDVAVSVLAEALGMGEGPRDLAPQIRRRLLMQALEAWLMQQAEHQPLLIVAEDLHWADPSLIELLRGVADLIATRRVMLLATYRSDFVLPWPDRTAMLRLALTGLSRSDATTMLEELLRQSYSGQRDAILARAGGVPLFLEEFALASGGPTVPTTLRQLFTARLDALGGAKVLAQHAAILGREVEKNLLVALCELPKVLIEEWLARLVAAEVMLPTDPASAATYAFRHALLQEAAYDSLLLTERRRLHGKAAALLAEHSPSLVERRPELLAEHYALAGEPAAATRYFAQAATSALAASALDEAETHVRRGLAGAANVRASQRTETELKLQILLGQILIARRGYASSVVQEAFERALAIAGGLSDDDRVLPLLRGLASFYQVRGPLAKAETIAARLVAAAERNGDACMLADAWRREAWNHLCMGRIVEAEPRFARVLEVFDQSRHEEHIAVAGNDPHVIALANLCWLELWRYGGQTAVRRAKQAVVAAQRSPHPVSACYGFIFAAAVLQQVDDWDEALRLADHVRAMTEEKGIVYWTALSQVIIGNDQVHRGNPAVGLAALVSGLKGYGNTEGELLRPFILSLLADAHMAAGAPDAAETVLREAIEVSRVLEADVFMPGLLLRLARILGAKDGRPRLDLLRAALDAARAQGADALASEVEAALNFDGRP